MNLLQMTNFIQNLLKAGKTNSVYKWQMFGLASNLQHNKAHQKTTVDPSDVKRHAQLTNDWWNEQGILKGLHSMNLIRIPFVRDGLVQCSTDGRNQTSFSNYKILDVGCGGGILSEGLARIGAKVTGIDAGKDLIDLATEHSKLNPKLADNQPSYICITIEKHAEERKNYYDGVVASEVIEHVYNKELFVKSCVETLKPGGKIFFTTPNRTRIAQVFGIFVAEYILNIMPKGTHQYDKFMTPPELQSLLEKNNCHVELTNGMVYYPFSNRWEVAKTQAFLFAMQAVKIK